MNRYVYLIFSIIVMAVVTYVIRALPLTVFKKKIESPFIKRFLYYIPYSVLAAMTIPAVFSSTETPQGSIAGFIAAVIMAAMGKSLPLTAAAAVAAAFIAELIIK